MRAVGFSRYFTLYAGSALLLGGCAVMVGWITQQPGWARPLPSGTATVFNTALCLALAGAALVWPAHAGRSLRLRQLIGTVVAALAALLLAQSLLRVDFGLDWPELHAWLGDGNPHPGRMAPNTAAALLLCAAALMLDARRPAAALLRLVLAGAVIAIGALGVLGYAVALDVVHDWYRIPRMAFATAGGVILLGAALLFDRHGLPAEAPTAVRDGHAHSYALLGAAVMLLASIAIVSYGSVDALRGRTAWLAHSHEVQAALEGLRSEYRHARIAWRSFVLDLGPAALREFDEATVAVRRELDRLTDLTVDSAAQQERLARMRPMVERDLATLTAAVRVERDSPSQSPEEAVARMRSVQLERPALLALAQAFKDDEQRLLERRAQEFESSSRSALLIIVAGNAAGFALLLWTFVMLKRRDDERQRAEQRLQRSNVFLDSLVENIPSMIFVKDATDLRFTRFNRAGEELLGYSNAELLGKGDRDFFPPSEAEAFTAADRAVLDGRRLLDIAQETVHTRHRGVRTLHTVKVPVLDADGTPLYLLGVSEDITERKQAEREIERLNASLSRRAAELEASNAELASFSYSVSHDLRAPLRAIDGFALMLEEDHAARLDDEGRRYLSVIRANSQRMGTLIDDLLAFSRLGRQAITQQPLDMNQLVDDVIAEVRQGEGSTAARIDVERLPPAPGDRALIRQVWANLLSNALKYSSKRAEPRVRVSGRSEGGEAIYTVADNGAGFDMEYADKLFGVFQRLHRADEFPGTGVGLAIVQRIVTRHGGSMRAEGKVDAGAEFSFVLPSGEDDE